MAFRFSLSTGHINGVYTGVDNEEILVESPSIGGQFRSGGHTQWGAPSMHNTGDYRDAKEYFSWAINPSTSKDKTLTGTSGSDQLSGSSGDNFGNDVLDSGGGNDTCYGHRGQDTLIGGTGDDWLHGNHGKDSITGGLGNDTLRGGHGKDEMIGGAGADWMWGGIGENTVKAGANDGVSDAIYVPVDTVQNSNYGNPGGVNRDLIYELDASDKLYLHGTGITDAMLTYANGVTDPNGTGNTGVGIYANGTLEALVIGSGLNAAQIDSMTTGGWYA